MRAALYYVYGLVAAAHPPAAGGSIVIDNRLAHSERRAAGHARTSGDGPLRGPVHVHAAARAVELRRDGAAPPAVFDAGRRRDAGRPPARTAHACARRAGVVMYDATEAAARLIPRPAMLESKLGSIGRAIPNVAITILRDDGSAASTGEVGELVARGSNISCRYWNAPDETAMRFGPQGYRTGDPGLHGRGRISVPDRAPARHDQDRRPPRRAARDRRRPVRASRRRRGRRGRSRPTTSWVRFPLRS